MSKWLSIDLTGLRKFVRKNPSAAAGFVAIVILLLAAWLIPAFGLVTDPNEIDVEAFLQPPSSEHIMGTDALGRDVFARILAGTAVGAQVVFFSVGIALVLGGIAGAVSGYLGGYVDLVINRVVDAMLAFPTTILALLIVASLGPSIFNTILAIGISLLPNYARLARSQVMLIRRMDYVNSAKVVGCGQMRIMFFHIIPNIIAPLIVFAMVQSGHAMLAEAGLSFLGLGVQPPFATWGVILSDFRTYLEAWWLAVFPGLFLFGAVLAFNLIGDGLRNHLSVNG